MRVKLKEKDTLSSRKIDAIVDIDNVELKGDIFLPEKEDIHIYFKGNRASGIINLSNKEAESLANSLKKCVQLVTKTKKFT